jgi:hypothetical protein
MGSRRRWPVEDWAEYLNTPRKVTRFYPDYRARAFVVQFGQRKLLYPFALLTPRPSTKDRYIRSFGDEKLGQQAIWYVLQSGKQGCLTAEQVLSFFYREPSDVKGDVLWALTMAAINHIKNTSLSRRQILRRMHTSSAQLDRILDASNVRKTVDGVLALLDVLGCEVEVTVRLKSPEKTPRPES